MRCDALNATNEEQCLYFADFAGEFMIKNHGREEYETRKEKADEGDKNKR